MAPNSKDPDGDSEMASSVDSIHADSDGAGSGARTPTRPAQASSAAAAAAASELSPPGSQPQQSSEFATISSLAAVPDSDISGTGKGADAPIAAWKSKRAQEDYQRAMESVIDQDFNLNEFGDPFDERDLEQKLS